MEFTQPVLLMVEIASDIKGLKDLAKNSDKLKKNFASTTLQDCPAERGPAGAQQGPRQGAHRRG